MIDWRQRYLLLAEHVAQWSKDPSTKVGCVLVNSDGIIVGTGYNGFPRGVKDTPERLLDRPTKYKMTIHAEVNAVLNASASVKGATAFCTHPPCSSCLGVLIQAGVIGVIHRPLADPGAGGYRETLEASRAMAEEARFFIKELGNGLEE